MSERIGPTRVDALPAPGVGGMIASKLPELAALAGQHDTAPAVASRVAAGDHAGFDLGGFAVAPDATTITGRGRLVDELDRAPLDPQLRPIIGAVDDQFEREADRMATRALGMPAPPTESSARAPEPATPEPALETGVEAPVDDAELMRGGRPLPEHLRTFFEGRLGFDLGQVRVHQGEESQRLNDVVAARAFTFGNHIWLGRGEAMAPTFTLAHELTHVVQQTQPESLRRRALGKAGAAIQRTPYWSNSAGTNPHNDLVTQLGKKLFTEAPIPGGAAGLAGHASSVGWADFYQASTAIGIAFDISPGTKPARPFSPWSAPFPKATTKKGSAFDRDTAAPRWNATLKKVVDVGSAPTDIKLGDVKPVPWSGSYLGSLTSPGWASQFKAYKQGVTDTRDMVNVLVDKGLSTTTKHWNVGEPTALPSGAIAIPAKFTIDKPGTTETLALFEGNKKAADQPKATVRGALKVFTKPQHDGVWHYAYIPTKASLTAAARREKPVDDLAREIEGLVRMITTPPDVTSGPKMPKKRPAPYGGRPGRMANRQLARLARDGTRQLRRDRKPPKDDTFSMVDWKAKQTELADKQKEPSTKDAWKDAVGQKKAYDAHVALQKLVPSIGDPPVEMKANAEAVGKADFWLTWKGRLLARLRKAFGSIFIKIAKAFYAIRKRVVEFFATAKAKFTGDKWWQKVIQIAWRVIKFAGPRLMHAVYNTLWDALARGIVDKIKQYIPIDAVEDEVRSEAAALAKKLGIDNPAEAFEDGDVAQIVDKIGADLGFGADFKLFETLVEVADVISDIATLISLLKWGVRIAAAGSQCAWPPAWGCLKIILLPLVEKGAEKLFEKVAETCWFQSKVAKYVAKIDLFQYFGKKIGVALIQRIQEASPELGSFFKISDVENASFNPDDFPCDDPPDQSAALSDEQWQIAEMANELGEDGLQKLADAMGKIEDSKQEPDEIAAQELTDTLHTPNHAKTSGKPKQTKGGKEEQKPDGKPKPTDTGKPEDRRDEGQPKPADPDDPDAAKGDDVGPKVTPKPAPQGEKAPGDKTPGDEGLKKPGEGKKEPGDAEGTDEPGGKPKQAPGGQPQGPGKSGSSKAPPGQKQGGQTPMQQKAARLIEKLEKLKGLLKGQQLKQKQKDSKSSTGGTAGTGTGKSGGGDKGGAAKQGDTSTGGSGTTPGGPGGSGTGTTGTGTEGTGEGAGQGGEPTEAPPGKDGAGKDGAGDSTEGKGTEGKGTEASDGKGASDKGDTGKKGGDNVPDQPADPAEGKSGQGAGSKGTGSKGAGAKPEPSDKSADAKPHDPVDDLVDLIDQLIELLKKIRDGQLNDNDEIDAAIAILVANAKNKVRLDPNAKRIIIVFEALGGTIEEGLGVKRKKPPKPPSSGDAVADAIDSLDGDPASTDDQGGGDQGEAGGDPKQGKTPPVPAAGDKPKPGQAGGDKDDDQGTEPPGPGDSGKDKPAPGPNDPPKPGKLAVLDFDPVWRDNIHRGYFVGILEPWRSAGLLQLSTDGTAIINRRNKIVARVKPAASGSVELVSGSLVPFLTNLARKLPDTPWTAPNNPTLEMNFTVPVYAATPDPDAPP